MTNNNYDTVTSGSYTINTNSNVTANTIYIPTTTTTTTTTVTSSSGIKDQMLLLDLSAMTLKKRQDDSDYKIIKVEVLCPNKVLRFTFNDHQVIKTICTKNDTFNFELAFYIAFAKKEFGHIYTAEGIFQKAKEMQYMKKYVKKVNAAIKLYNRDLKAKEKEEREKEERKLIKQNRIKKQQEKKHKARQMRITEIEEAIRRASLSK